MILKTYTRILTTDFEGSLAILRTVYGVEPHYRNHFMDWDAAGIGDVLLIAGTEETLKPLRGTFGPLIVEDLDTMERTLVAAGAEITQPIEPGPTGRYLFARHPEGSVVEYCQWRDDLVESWIRRPQLEGKLSSQL